LHANPRFHISIADLSSVVEENHIPSLEFHDASVDSNGFVILAKGLGDVKPLYLILYRVLPSTQETTLAGSLQGKVLTTIHSKLKCSQLLLLAP